MTRNHQREPVEMDNKKDLARISRCLRKLTKEELLSLASSVKEKNWQPMDMLLKTYSPKLRERVKLRDELQAQVKELAEFNYAREPEFARDRTECLQLIKGLKAMGAGTSCTKLKSIMDKALDKLLTSAAELEQESERLAQQFLQGELAYTTFQTRYIELRKQTNLKRTLADRMAKDQSQWSSITVKLAIDDDDEDDDGDQYSVLLDSD